MNRKKIVKKVRETETCNRFSEDKLRVLIEKYEEFYKKNKFNTDPTVWDTNSNYIKNSFNLKFRGENAYMWQEQLGDNEKTYKRIL